MCQDSSMQQVWLWGCMSITVAFDKSTWWSHENMLSKSRNCKVSVL